MLIEAVERFVETFTSGACAGGVTTPELAKSCLEVSEIFPTNLAGATFVICAGIVPETAVFAGMKVSIPELALDVLAANPVTAVFFATTEIEYFLFCTRSLISHVVAGSELPELVVAHCWDEPDVGVAVTMYLAIAEPPLLDGAVQRTVVLPSEETAETFVGAVGSPKIVI